MPLPRRRTHALDDPTARPERRVGRRARLVAAGLVTVLAAGAAYVVIDRDALGRDEPIYVVGDPDFIEVDVAAQDERGERRERRRERRDEPRADRGVSGFDAGLGRRLVIPSLGVESDIVSITAPGGTLTPPDDALQVGWWAAGAEPGAEWGSALVTGHTLSSGRGALQDLETLAPGDRMSVRTPGGRIPYRVQEVEVFSKGAVAAEAERLFSQQVPGRLVVITCEDYNGSVYLSNVVVTATPIGQPSVDF